MRRLRRSEDGGAGAALLWAGIGVGGFALARAVVRRVQTFDFDGRVALVTGGTRGLGLVIARELAQRGAAVAVCARDQDEVDRAQRDLERHGARRVLALRCDLTQSEQIAALVGRIEDELGAVDVLVNNAGIIQVGPAGAMQRAEYEDAMKLHFFAPLELVRAVLPRMKRRREGRIVNISSIGGRVAVPHLLPYVASKFALAGFSDALRLELARDGIKVTTVAPGLMRTGSTRHALFKGDQQLEYRWFTVGSVLPVLSMSVERAARRIVTAAAQGRAELVLTMPAKLAIVGRALFPELTADLLALADRFILPDDDEERGGGERRGAEIEPPSGAAVWAEAASRAAGDQAQPHREDA